MAHDDSVPRLVRCGHDLHRDLYAGALAALVFAAPACGACDSQGRKPSASQVTEPPRPVNPPASSRNSEGKPPVAAAEQPPSSTLQGYAFAEPDRQITLPAELNEISGLAAMSESEVACVQDEDGVVYLYNLDQQKVTERVRFGPSGDYEGIARVDDRLFVLRSDGTVYDIEDPFGAHKVTTRNLNLPTDNNEGLCFDRSRNQLLVGPKSRMGKGREYKDVRPIYAFDLGQQTLKAEPALLLSVDAIRRFAEARDQDLPEKEKKKGGRRVMLRFMPASLEVHPKTSELVVISAEDQVLASFDMRSNVTGYALLDAARFPQPEAITFLPSGDLLVANEAAGKIPTLFRFRWRGKGP